VLEIAAIGTALLFPNVIRKNSNPFVRRLTDGRIAHLIVPSSCGAPHSSLALVLAFLSSISLRLSAMASISAAPLNS